MVSPAFASVLAAGRADFNRRALEAKRHHHGFDDAAFAAFLGTEVDGVVAAVAQAAPERIGEVASAAFDVALELTGLRLVGPRARSPLVAQAWRTALPRCAHLLAHAAEQVIGTVCNAVVHLESLVGARPGQWIDELAALAPRVETPHQLRALGQVLAWRAGAAHYRAGALAAADSLPEALALAALRAPDAGSWPRLRAGIEADLWWRAAADDAVPAGWEVGAFTGFGGQFAAPPQVRSSGGHFLLRAGERHFLLLADAYGTSLLSAGAEEFDAAALDGGGAPRFAVEGGALVVEGRRIALDLPAEGLAVCATGATLAVSSPYTHAVRLLPRR